MTFLSLVCLLALSSAAFGRSVNYGGYGATTLPRVEVSSGYGETLEPKVVQGAYGSALVSAPLTRVVPSTFSEVRTLEVEPTPLPLAPAPFATQADILCRGRLPETVIPIDGNRRFITCLDDGKGVEQECQKGLLYNEMSRRCERKLGPSENFCASQPCFNGGQCILTDSWFTCQCPTGFDGPTCELDARICHTQNPCGASPDTICQSFRVGAALEYMCIFQDGFSYGLNGQQTHANPCGDFTGPHALANSNGGFIMCNGDRMHIESCPGGTTWDSFNRACAWPDMIFAEPSTRILERTGSYGETRAFKSGYGAEKVIAPRVSTYGGYGAEKIITPRVSTYGGYGAEKVILPKVAPSYGGYGAEKVILPKVAPSYGGYGAEKVFLPKVAPSYGGYGAEKVFLPKVAPSYGGERTIITQKVVDTFGGDRTLIRPRVMDNYGAEKLIVAPKVVDSYGAEKTVIAPKVVDSYGGETLLH